MMQYARDRKTELWRCGLAAATAPGLAYAGTGKPVRDMYICKVREQYSMSGTAVLLHKGRTCMVSTESSLHKKEAEETTRQWLRGT
jgi:hypothetical protein